MPPSTPLEGGGREGDGVRKRNAMLKCDKVELKTEAKATTRRGNLATSTFYADAY